MWAHPLNALLGVWLMAASDVLGYSGSVVTSDRIVGPIVASFGVIAIGECTRNIRFWILPFAIWVFCTPFVFDMPLNARLNESATGAAMAVLTLFKGTIHHNYAGGWIVLFRRDPYRQNPRVEAPAIPGRSRDVRRLPHDDEA